MANKYLDYDGLLYFWGKIKLRLATKVDKNDSITAATKTKITYDAKGLVTSGADATTADIADSNNKRYVTEAEKVKLTNTSGTNTGDETAQTVGTLISGATAKAAPADTDLLGVTDSTATHIIKKLSWADLKGSLKTYFGAIYSDTAHNHNTVYQPLDADLTSISGITGTSGSLIKTAAHTWSLDTKTYTVANTAITGNTKVKITYDSKGLVTAGADLAVGDIPSLSGLYLAVGTKGSANGVCPLGSDSLVPSQYLPSYVDDVVECLVIQLATAAAPSTAAIGDKYFNFSDSKIYTATAVNTWGTVGEAPMKDKIYVSVDKNTSYRWGGTQMILITSDDMVGITNAEIDTILAA